VSCQRAFSWHDRADGAQISLKNQQKINHGAKNPHLFNILQKAQTSISAQNLIE
jgi:hypothetical protein